MKENNFGIAFIVSGLILLALGLLFGLIGGVQYVSDNFLTGVLPFYKTRPLHVYTLTAFIILTSSGGIYYYLYELFGEKGLNKKLSAVHFLLFLTTTIIIIVCFLMGYFGGREYLEYPPVLALPIIITWILFGINYIRSIKVAAISKAPVYIWMWATGILFFTITYLESYLWMFPYFRDNIVRDITIQWKSLGSMVGAWNMLIYGTAFYLMEKIGGNEKLPRSRITFFLYFIGLTNLMFNWGHHTYIVPHAPWIKTTAYIISMSELLILGNIIINWKKTLSSAQKNYLNIPYRLLLASDIWIFLNLILAITISIPAINRFTHGTHITVAHAMGTTIGINTFILLASVYYIFSKRDETMIVRSAKIISIGFWLTNISLLVFWISLLIAGVIKGQETIPGSIANFNEIMDKLKPYLNYFTIAGAGVCLGIYLLIYPLIESFLTKYLLKKFEK